MATIAELLPFLQQGYTLQSVRGESLRPLGGHMVAWHKSTGYGFQTEPEKYSLGQMSAMSDMWSWGVVFTTDGKSIFIETELATIEQLIARETGRSVD